MTALIASLSLGWLVAASLVALVVGRVIQVADRRDAADAERRRQSLHNHPTNARNRDLVTV